MRHCVVGVDDVVIAEGVFAVLHGFGFGGFGSDGDVLGVGRPVEAVDSILQLCELLGFAAIDRHEIKLRLVFGRVFQLAGA